MTAESYEQNQPNPSDEVQADIAQTREELGKTVEALSAKTDVKARLKTSASQVTSQAKQLGERAGRVQLAVAGATVMLFMAWLFRRGSSHTK